MTSQPQPLPGEGRTAGQILRALRDLAVYALVGATAVLLFVGIIRLIPDGSGQFSGRVENSFYSFISLETILFPLAAVLLALLVQPQHPKARLVVIAAVVEYGVAAFFGVIFGVLIGLIRVAADSSARTAFEELLIRLAWLAVFAVAAWAVFQLWQGLFTTPKPPKPVAHPGVYGQPQYNMPGAYPGQPGYGPPPGQPGPPPGQPYYPPQPGVPGQPGAPNYGPGAYGQPQQPPPWNQPPAHYPAPQEPVSAAPASAAPTSAAPAPVTSDPPAYDAFSEPTQAVPRHQEEPADERTQIVDHNRPGYGPAGPDAPRS